MHFSEKFENFALRVYYRIFDIKNLKVTHFLNVSSACHFFRHFLGAWQIKSCFKTVKVFTMSWRDFLILQARFSVSVLTRMEVNGKRNEMVNYTIREIGQ